MSRQGFLCETTFIVNCLFFNLSIYWYRLCIGKINLGVDRFYDLPCFVRSRGPALCVETTLSPLVSTDMLPP